jgi:hypothetical protein
MLKKKIQNLERITLQQTCQDYKVVSLADN